jgi:hypothetical protein
LRDICINQPDFPKVTEICVKIIRRIADEEGIKVSTPENVPFICSFVHLARHLVTHLFIGVSFVFYPIL